MSTEPNGNQNELRRIVRMLEKTASMAEHASLTGSMAGGKEFAVRSYNSVLTHLAEQGEIPAALFPPLPEGASLDEVGIASAQLAEYVRAGIPEPQEGQGAGASKLGDNNVFFNIGGLGEIGELVREHLPEWLRGKREQNQPQAESQEATASDHPPPAETPNPAVRLHPRATGAPLPPQRARIEELRPERQPEETSR
jgi:hypothetical protein